MESIAIKINPNKTNTICKPTFDSLPPQTKTQKNIYWYIYIYIYISTTITTPILLHIPLSHQRPYPPPFDRNLANPTMESTTINIYQTKSYQNPTKTPKSEINLKTPKKKYTKIACLWFEPLLCLEKSLTIKTS